METGTFVKFMQNKLKKAYCKKLILEKLLLDITIYREVGQRRFCRSNVLLMVIFLNSAAIQVVLKLLKLQNNY